MKYRRLTATGDYVFGQGQLDYLTDADAVAQVIKTTIKLLLGEWWEDVENGFPLFQQALLQRNTLAGIQAIDLLIKDRILTIPEVTEVVGMQSKVKNQRYTTQITVNTIYGKIQDTIELEV